MAIEVLSSEVIDQIAAGEVVERPAHLVKELVENSIDAGATRIQVEFDFGGRFVKISDNGCGMSQEDLSKCLGRHATSKIRAASDLWGLKSFGFRGEALSSISAVSRTTLISRQPGSETAFKLVSEFGAKSTIDAVGGGVGTTIVVEDLFANLPVRLKFLKSETAEHTQIKLTLKSLALANPEIEFRVSSKGKLLNLWTKTENRLARAKQIFENQDLYFCSHEREGFKVEGVFSSPSQVTQTSRSLYVFVQNRVVQDKGLQAAMTDSYRNLLMHGEFPLAICWLSCDPQFVDVNIHPTKSQVKFQDPSLAFRVVHRAFRSELEKAPWAKFSTARASSPAANDSSMTAPGDSGNVSMEMSVVLTPHIPTNAPTNLTIQAPEIQNHVFAKKIWPIRQPTVPGIMEPVGAVSTAPVMSKSFELPPVVPASPGPTFGLNKADIKPANILWGALDIVGQAQLTYIVAQSGENIFLIDQHAAHERIVFERLMSGYRSGKLEIQDQLFAQPLKLSEDQVDALLKHSHELKKMGIELEQLGPQEMGVKSAPAILKGQALTKALQVLASEINEKGGSFAIEKSVADVFASMACHSVVRAGQALSAEEMRNILVQMDESPLSGFCPHGRPVHIELTRQRIEKEFGRIV